LTRDEQPGNERFVADEFMTAERSRRIEGLLDAAIDLTLNERREFLDKACQGDPSLRREVERLLLGRNDVGEFIETPATEAAAELFSSGHDESLVGRSVLHYNVLSSLGSGGMGQVYLARDTRLGRPVALKLLRHNAMSNKDRLRRFKQEACAASALNHPNILTIYEVAQQDDLSFIVTEFVEGETLRERLCRGPIPPAEAIELAVQITSALAAAHDSGIVHRDIKPENVMVRPDGLVKVLDFGLAKLTQRPKFGLAVTSTDGTALHTGAGVLMGTANYMSPEQARGQSIDARSDVFSLGVLFYEMLAGIRPFVGETLPDVLVAILEKEHSPLRDHVPDAPTELELMLNRALAKKREQRQAHAGQLLDELNKLRRELETAASDQPVCCPICESGNPANCSFCGKCGSPLKKTCQSCGNDITAGDNSCGSCGHRFAEAQAMTAGTHFDARPTAQMTQSAGSVGAGRRTATILYTSVSGCAEILEQLDPEEADREIAAIKDSVTQVITSHGGMIDRLSGEELVALFGVPTTYEDDFVRAVRAGLALRDHLNELSAEVERKLPCPLLMYAGVSSGSVVTRVGDDGKFSVSGEALQIASRLAARAEAGEILLSPETQRLVAPYFTLEEKGELTLDGKGQPVAIYRVAGESGVQTRLEAAAVFGLTRYTGREKELSELKALLEKSLAGESQFVTVFGDAGVGKSRLLLEFRRFVAQKDVSILKGRCQSHGSNISYSPFIDLLRDLLGLQKEESPEKLRDRAVANIRHIDPNLESYIPIYLHLLSIQGEWELHDDLQGEDLRLRIHEAIAAIFSMSSRRAPSIIMLEDWHWADRGSDEALKRLAGLASAHQLMIIVTGRPERAVDWGYSETQSVMHLAPLDELSSILVMKSSLRVEELPAGLGDLLYRRTGGNPFFIEELCRTLIEEGRIRTAEGKALLAGSLEDLNLPDTVQSVIRTRLDRLDPESLNVLRHASVLGREFNLPVLERMIGGAPLARCLQLLQQQGLIQQLEVLPEALFRFKHVLTQQVAYDSLLAHQRRTLHEAAGRAIEQLYEDRIEERLELLVHHYGRAENWSRATRFGIESAEKASRLSRFPESLKILEQTEEWLAHLPDDANRMSKLIEVLLKQERLSETLGMRDRQQVLIDRVLSLLDHSRDQSLEAEVLVRQGELHTLMGRFDQAEEVLVRALSIRRSLSDKPGERVALRTIGFLCWQRGNYDEAISFNKEAIAIDRGQEDSAGYAQDLTSLGSILRSAGKPREALVYLDEALAINEALNKPFSLAYVLDVTANVYRDLGQHDKAMDYYRRATEVAGQHRLPIFQVFTMNMMASLCWERGDVDECLRLNYERVALTESLNLKRELAEALSVLGQRLLELERFQDAVAHLKRAAVIFSELEQTDERVKTLTKLAYAYERCGVGPDRGVPVWEEVRAINRETGNAPGELEALEGMARIARDQALDPKSALKHLRQAVALAPRSGNYAKEGDLLNTIGIIEWGLSNYAEALDSFERALVIFRDMDDRAHIGLMLNSVGVTLHKLGRSEEAVARLQEALSVHRESGERLLEGHALAALADALSDAGSLESALEHYRSSLDIRRKIADRTGEGWVLYHMARVFRSLGSYDEARIALQQASVIGDETANEHLVEACASLKAKPVRQLE
jgi:serine/threonine protein kinase/tetratricopeptide (TPR) repeat protein/class 3 adenylate cyclase